MAENARGFSPGLKWLLLLILGIAPALLCLATVQVSFQRAETLSFCSSCHTMDPWVNDLKDPNSKALAALHYKNRYILDKQCYRCHADYDLFGPVKAKMNGMHHVIAFYSGHIHNPIRLYKPFPNGNCLQCHSESAKFTQNEAHMPIMDDIRSGEMKCSDCHGPIHTPKQEATSAQAH